MKLLKTFCPTKTSFRILTFILPYLILFLVFFIFPTKLALAQIPEPYVKCGDTATPEFHSLRPYQASPCTIPINEDEQAKLCGNNLKVKDTFVVTPEDAYECIPDPETCPDKTTCYFRIPRLFEIFVNAYESEYPIAGNTELIEAGKTKILPSNEKRLSDWKEAGKIPPDPTDYEDFSDYWTAYQVWRGKTCVELNPLAILNFKSFKFCFENILDGNYWSNLFQYIPYSSTEDRIGKLYTSDMFVVQANFGVQNLQTIWQEKPRPDDRNANTENSESVLYFPHMEEGVELSTLLQSTYLTQDLLKKEQPIGEVEEPKIENECKILDVRYNPGDQLFGETMDEAHERGVPLANVSYTAVFSCVFDVEEVGVDADGDPICQAVGSCRKTAIFGSTIDTYTPMIDELWSKTVSGNASIFKKIFPKIETGAPVEKIKDIPATSDVIHAAKTLDTSYRAQTTVLSIDPKLYFPHLGGIYDYFLKEIQTALRPQGYKAEPAGLTKSEFIKDPDKVSEYLSWYLNGTLFRAENDPLGNKDQEDLKKVTSFSGPLNKLLPQWIQWRNKVDLPKDDQQTGRVDEITPRAGKNRHNQIVVCTFGIKIPFFIPFFGGKELGAFPVACNKEKLASVGLTPEGEEEGDTGASCEGQDVVTPAEPVGSGPGNMGSCEPAIAGWCSPSTLSKYLPGKSSEFINNLSIICLRESGGYTNAFNDNCTKCLTADFSIGLFQINLLPENRCPGAFKSYSKNPPSCVIGDAKVLQECVDFYSDPENNIEKAANMINDAPPGEEFCPWRTRDIYCGIDTSICFDD